MKQMRAMLLGLACAAVAVAAGAAAQTTSEAQTASQTQTTPQAPPVPAEPQLFDQPAAPPDVRDRDWDRWGVAVVRVGQDYRQGPSETNRKVVVILGSAEIAGRVNGDVRVFLGDARVLSTAVIEGSLVVAGGSATVSPGAIVRRDLVVLGGGYEGPPDFTPRGESVVVGARSLGGRFAAVVPWFTRGLLWGRPIVPSLPWIWMIVGLFFLIYLAMNVVLFEAVGSGAKTLETKPLTAFMVGLLVLLLIGPICVLLAVSIIGVAVIPFVLCALIIAAIIGRVAVTRALGTRVLRQETPDAPARSVVPFVVGFVVLCLVYMIPVLGIVTWTMVGVFGLGASTLAFITAYRRESPPPPPRPEPSSVVSPQPPPSARWIASDAGAEGGVSAESTVSPPIVPAAPAASDLISFPHASLMDRVAAAFLDLILVVIAAQVLDIFNRNADDGFFFLLVAYHIGFCAWKGTTVGGIIMQLRVVKVDGTPIRFVDALVRGLSAIFSAVVLGLGFLWILKDPERQAWHDRIAGTYVVKVPRNWPI
jgi:uncharacterized RDD family membrane protein YckC